MSASAFSLAKAFSKEKPHVRRFGLIGQLVELSLTVVNH